MNLIDKAYVNLSEISKDIGMDRKKLRAVLEEKNIKKYDIGYRSSEVISNLNLTEWIKIKRPVDRSQKESTHILSEERGKHK